MDDILTAAGLSLLIAALIVLILVIINIAFKE